MQPCPPPALVHPDLSTHQGGGSADDLALGVILGAVAVALELVLGLRMCTHAEMSLPDMIDSPP